MSPRTPDDGRRDATRIDRRNSDEQYWTVQELASALKMGQRAIRRKFLQATYTDVHGRLRWVLPHYNFEGEIRILHRDYLEFKDRCFCGAPDLPRSEAS